MDIVTPLRLVREQVPLVQCITNFVTVNDCANILLAAGGTPSMAHWIDEVEEAVAGAQALVCNMGAIEDTNAMLLAGARANALGIPVVLDPVAVGSTELRRSAAKRLLAGVHFAAIRGNASEIRWLYDCGSRGRGVDAAAGDSVSVDMARSLAQRLRCVIAVSGAADVISDGKHCAILHNGCASMSRITGSGCMVTSLIGAFCGAMPDDPFSAVVSAMTVMGLAGEMAEEQRLRKGSGNATFRTDLIDAVFNMTEDALKEGARYEIL